MAIDTTQETHRPGALKQQNKTHKHGRHKSKGALESLKKGRTMAKAVSQKAKRELNRKERRNMAVQMRHKKRQESMMRVRDVNEPPFLIALVPLNINLKTAPILELFKNVDSQAVVSYTAETHLHVGMPRFGKRFTLAECNSGNVLDVLDYLKVADSVLFLVSTEGIDATGELLLTAALAQGLPSTNTAAVNLSSLPVKKHQAAKMQLQKSINRWLPDEKVMMLEKESDSLLVLRKVCSQKLRRVIQRDNRPHLLAEKVEYVPNEQGSAGTVKLTGYLRGQNLSVNSLVHVAGWGDFQMSRIDSHEDPHIIKGCMVGSAPSVYADPKKQESLDRENIPDPMDAEQTWPTEEEMAEAEERIKLVKRVPAGMSDYQAAWIPECDAEEMESDDDEEESEEEVEGMECVSEEESEEGEEAETMTVTSEAPVATDKYDQEHDETEEQEALRKIKESKMDQMFPDEVDTPMDTPARVRFQKYRGLKSFRTSPWDTKENLPSDYARIFQFQNFDKTKKRVLKEREEADYDAWAGWYITVYIKSVPEELFASRLGNQPLVMYGQLPHEQKMSVVNVALRRPAVLRYDEPIQSKESLVFQCGYRRFRAAPIFSQHTNGAKHKYERFFQPEATVVATMYAPIIFPPASVLAFKEKKDGSQVLVATGNVLSVNPDRIVIKRAVLSGHPFKIHKRSAVVRFMFFNREDINWFKPVELRTKFGRRGHIKEPLGTHGHMKCVFDGQLKSMDTVLLNLYKRVFPKWTFDPDVQFKTDTASTSMETS
ncbi:pre-rRNA-processing protein TSR1 homolog [Macrosteles quadrilineatus]|uniref:pre-rRNA-processing protein TSR1 homolog n=1 Tax=Macrosteles quadrilineatus TaxID=74068 RepID=UPI0023E16FEA|nr:pre-rRNA-processing protein TSR1 homolog [Macrosteles quadrilineatus]